MESSEGTDKGCKWRRNFHTFHRFPQEGKQKDMVGGGYRGEKQSSRSKAELSGAESVTLVLWTRGRQSGILTKSTVIPQPNRDAEQPIDKWCSRRKMGQRVSREGGHQARTYPLWGQGKT